MLIRFLKQTETSYKNWILNAYSEIVKNEMIPLTQDVKDILIKDLDWASDENNTWHNILICEENENILGYCWYLKQTVYPFGGGSYPSLRKPYIWVHSIYTDPNKVRKGIATMLYSKLEEIAKTENVNKIYLDIYPTNVISESFHCKNGFEKEAYIYSKKL